MFAEPISVAVVPGVEPLALVAIIAIGVMLGRLAYDLVYDVYDGIGVAVKRLVRWWESRPPTAVGDATADPMAQRPTKPIVRKGTFTPEVPSLPPALQVGVVRWYETTTAVHTAECHLAKRGEPLHFILTVDELREMLERTGKRACRHCDPLEERSREDTGDLEAVSK
jgi:hypothetical protein